MSVNESVHVIGGTRVVIRDCKKADTGNNYQLRLLVGRGGAGGAFESIQSNIHTRLKVMDANDRQLNSHGWSTSGRADELEMTVTYSPTARDGRGAGEPAKLVWEVPVYNCAT